MEAKDKAIDLKAKFFEMIPDSTVKCNKEAEGLAVLNAIICVDEILHDAKQSYKVTEEPDIHPHAQGLIVGTIRYWNEVKQELEKMK